ncbi:MAG: SDR family oxidoreductase [Deltaproteobacteria bacterium]|nr:SDR family oxidoreductase [Deltaproteobacteria bacterium]
MNGKILVVGATGNIGRTLVDALVEKGESIKAASHPDDPYPQQNNVEAVPFDFYNPETFPAALEGVDRVFTICLPKELDSDKNINPLVDQAKAAGVKHFILVTAMGVEHAGEDLGYRRAELHLIASGMDYTILRPGAFTQMVLADFILRDIKNRSGIYLPAGDGNIAFIDARDIAAVAAKALTEDGHVGKEYTLTGDKAIGFSEVAKILSGVAGRLIDYAIIPEDELREKIEKKGGYPGPIEFLGIMFQAMRDNEFAQIDPTLPELLGRAPLTFEQFAEDHKINWK